MKKQKPIITPDMLPKLDIDLKNIDFELLASKESRDQFKNSDAHKKYVQPVLDRGKSLKKQQRKDWWKQNYWNIINTLLAAVAILLGLMD